MIPLDPAAASISTYTAGALPKDRQSIIDAYVDAYEHEIPFAYVDDGAADPVGE